MQIPILQAPEFELMDSTPNDIQMGRKYFCFAGLGKIQSYDFKGKKKSML